MDVFTDISVISSHFSSVVATVGNFDGVHLGHQYLIKELVQTAQKTKSKSLVISFSPHPSQMLHPERGLKLIYNIKELETQLANLGVEGLLLIPFTEAFAEISGADFVRRCLLEHLNLKALILGYDSSFGLDRISSPEVIRSWFANEAILLSWIKPLKTPQGTVISSSLIRECIQAGRVAEAQDLMGRPFAVSGTVVKGEGRGRQLSFPTANLSEIDELVPKIGVYATRAKFEGQWHLSITNIGLNPTFKESHSVARIETHILDHSSDLYGKVLDLEFLKFIRSELKFPGPDELIEQIKKDVVAVREFFKNYEKMG